MEQDPNKKNILYDNMPGTGSDEDMSDEFDTDESEFSSLDNMEIDSEDEEPESVEEKKQDNGDIYNGLGDEDNSFMGLIKKHKGIVIIIAIFVAFLLLFRGCSSNEPYEEYGTPGELEEDYVDDYSGDYTYPGESEFYDDDEYSEDDDEYSEDDDYEYEYYDDEDYYDEEGDY